MTAAVELLPLPEGELAGEMRWGAQVYGRDEMRAYARANLAPLQSEIEELRAEVERVNSWNERVSVCRDHVADIVDGPCVICALDAAKARADKLAEALRHQRWCRTCAEDGWESCEEGRKNDALLRDQEEGR